MKVFLSLMVLGVLPTLLRSEVGDPQLRTDHPWYPGELSCSTYPRLFATQEELYRRVTGRSPGTDEERALASWMWRNTHFFHAEEGAENLWGKGFSQGPDLRTREYWTGLFAHGFGLCGTTHSQWCAEMEALLGHGRGRGVGVQGHNSFEVFLTGGAYGQGKWALLDHDISTVIFNEKGTALLSIAETQKDYKKWTSQKYLPGRQPWLVCGLHPGDGGVFQKFAVAEYLAGYAGPPPMVNLRRGETLRRYFEPGLADGKTFVFWGRNYNADGIPGPERSQTWVNQPDRMYQAKQSTPHKPGQARYANAVFVYKPDFSTEDYREGVVDESGDQITFSFQSPYIIAATPSSPKDWGIYEPGCKNGLVLNGKAECAVAVSVDRGQTWHEAGKFRDGLDLTDRVKGYRQYLLRFGGSAKSLRDSGLVVTTVCQANASILPRLKSGGTVIDYASSGQGLVSVGPTVDQAKKHIVAGQFDSPKVTLEVATPHGEPVQTIHVAAHIRSSNPPRPEIKYQVDYSTDRGKTWKSLLKDWSIPRRGEEPKDFWSQSLLWGSLDLSEKDVSTIQVRFHNNGGKQYARAEVHLAYRCREKDATKVTYAWTDDNGPQRASKTFADAAGTWDVPTGRDVRTHWVEMENVRR